MAGVQHAPACWPFFSVFSLERFLSRISIDPLTGCWPWLGNKRSIGYGVNAAKSSIDTSPRAVHAHRLSYQWFVGPVPDGLELDHLCSRRDCVNPDHLEPVTHFENTRRAWQRKTHCKQGHAFIPENIYWNPSTGHRSCLVCRRMRNAARSHRSCLNDEHLR